MNAPTTESAARRPVSREMSKILADCRDLAIHRLLLAFTTLMDKVSDMLMERAGRTEVREEQQMYMDARGTLKSQRASLMSEFEKRMRTRVNDGISGKTVGKADFSKVDVDKLTLVDTSAMDESVVTGNITRVVENLCHDELQTLNRAIGHLLGNPDLETDGNPLAPAAIVDAFAEALKSVKGEDREKFLRRYRSAYSSPSVVQAWVQGVFPNNGIEITASLANPSTQVILDAAMAVIDKHPGRTRKQLFTERQGGVEIFMHEAYNEEEEAQFTLETLQDLAKRRQAAPGDCAIMYRTNAQSRAVEEAFIRGNQPYKLVGAQRFYGRKEVKDVLSYLRLIHNPADSVSLRTSASTSICPYSPRSARWWMNSSNVG